MSYVIDWIPVDIRLPEAEKIENQPGWTESEYVWAWGDITSYGDEMFLAAYDHNDSQWFTDHGNLPHGAVRYWHPKPEPPKGCGWSLYPSQVAAREEKGTAK